MFFYWECKAGQIIIYVFHTFKCLNYLHYSKLKRLQKILNEQLKEPLSYCSGQNQTNKTVYGHHIIVTGVDLSGCPTSTIRSCFRALDHPHTYPLFVSPSSSRTTPPPLRFPSATLCSRLSNSLFLIPALNCGRHAKVCVLL